jgi:hypothetical protein
MRHTVIARYTEDVSWVDVLLRTPHTIVNKGQPLNNNASVMNVENVGREAESYLQFIILNYEKLQDMADDIVFCQADPIDHVEHAIVGFEPKGFNTRSGNITDFAQFLNTYPPVKQFTPLGSWYSCNEFALPHWSFPEQLAKYCKRELHIDLPGNTIWFVAGAQFIVPVQSILQHPRIFYEHLLRQCHTCEYMPYMLERVWSYIFTYTPASE